MNVRTLSDRDLLAVTGGKNVDVVGYLKEVGKAVVGAVGGFVGALPGVGGGSVSSHDPLPGKSGGVVPL